jgi:hypothetical protein
MSLRAIRARTAERKAAGAAQTYPQHAGKRSRRSRGPCKLVGRELTGRERAARGLDHARRWALCLHPDRPLGEAVCGCKGCGPGCRGYVPAVH